MSHQNVDVVRGLVAALNDRDVDAMVTRFYSPQAEFIPALQAALEGTVYRGSAEIRGYYDELYELWEDFRVDVADISVAQDAVLAIGRVIATGKASGLRLDRTWTFVFKLRNGRVVWHRNFLDDAEAHDAVKEASEL